MNGIGDYILRPQDSRLRTNFLNSGHKRGSDELMSGVSNGSLNNSNHAEVKNEPKKAKLDRTPNPPSKVVHIRSIPLEVTETEIVHLGIPFGKVTNVLVLKGKNQAFLEMGDEASAVAMVNYFSNCDAQIRGRGVYVQFSNYKELKTDQSHSNSNANSQAALQAANALTVNQPDTQGGPNTVLRVIVENMIYPVTLDVLHQIFSRVGRVLKIITFTKNNSFQALIQYPGVVEAQAAKMTLDGQNIYNSCCNLRIDYSKLATLNVKYNNDKSRDYTNPNLASGDHSLDNPLGSGGPGLIPNPYTSLPDMSQLPPMMGSNAGLPFSGLPLGGGGLNPMSASMRMSNMAMNNMPMGNMQGQQMNSTVLLVTNLDEEKVNCDALFTLFGVYGNVMRVKILYNKKQNALVQMQEPHQAQLALTHLDKARLWGRQLRLNGSCHSNVQMPKEGQSQLTKDFANSTLHRFKKPGSKNYQNIYPPSSTLHLSNIPADVTEEQIRDAFEENCDCSVKAFKFFQNDHKMALIQLDNTEVATEALIKMHDFPLTTNQHLRVSFSKTSMQN